MFIGEFMKYLHKITCTIYNMGLKTVQLLTLLLMVVLTLCSLFWGYYAEEMESQASISHTEPIFLHLTGILTLLLLLFLLLKCSGRHIRVFKRTLLGFTMCWYCFWGLFLILCGRSIPAADSASVYSIAQALAFGQTGVIHPTDSYLSYYPQQIGLVAFYEIIIRLWNLLPINYAAYYVLQCINVAMSCIIVYFQYKITSLLTRDNDAATICYLFLALLNAPLVIYTSFVYGEIPSFALLCAGLYTLLAYYMKQSLSCGRRYLYLFCSLPLLILSVALRKNSLIVIIAVLLTLVWEWLRVHRNQLLLYAILLLVGSFSILPCIQKIYEYRADNVLSTGVPAISYVAMGMQESSRGNGWYNGFNFYTFESSNLDTSITASKSREAIQDSLSAFRKNPGYAFQFYKDKFLSQWTDGSYFCRQATLAHTDGRSRIIESLYTGSLSLSFNHYCNIYQLLIYIGALLCLLWLSSGHSRSGQQSPSLLPYIGMIAVLGGFLFHMVWEANSRYILPYFLLLLPYAAMGLSNLYTILSQKISHLSR